MKKILLFAVVAAVFSGCAQPMIKKQNDCRLEVAKLQYLKKAHNVLAKTGTEEEYQESLAAVKAQAIKVQQKCGGR